ncbi:potassium-transporting ATPase subunit C [Streptosporangium subroseum]|uniref:potassium-transporting ATPase subunit C n=1 Tax=Streptosporangium subroseum TaxID=106412 RepID=UPI00308516F4|nr:potassium-transporting ATPase subunit C [Streptosporangium subroseum]
MNRIPPWVTRHLAALRVVLVLTVTVGLLYPLAMTGIAQALFNDQADGSRIGNHGSALIGQSFTDAEGNPLRQYFQSRPSAAGTLRTHGPNFVVLATGAALILALLNFLPALSLGVLADGLLG